MFRLFNFLVFVITSVYAAGEFSVLNSPDSVVFEGHDQVKESTLTEAISAALGFTTERYSKWEGIYITDPFSLPEAAVTVVVDGVSDIGLVKGHHFPMRTDEDEFTIYNTIAKRISSRYPEQKSNLVRIDLSDDLNKMQLYDVLGSIKNDKPPKSAHSFLRNEVDEDREFLREIGLLNAISNKIEKGAVKRDFIPDIYWFKVSSLHPLQDLYGENSTAVKEAKQLLNEAIIRLNQAFTTAYDGSVLVTVITSDASHTRRSRSILQTATAKENVQNPHNLAKNYSKNYPVIFNIILWFGVIMVFTLLAISMVIGTMDPGRDSIIYRMTSTRMKKDN